MKTVAELIRAKGHEVQGVQRDTLVALTGQMFLDAEVSSLLVYDRNSVVGIFTKNDLIRCCCRERVDLSGERVDKFMTTSLVTTAPTALLDEVFDTMVKKGLHHMPVMEGDKAVGMITPLDIVVRQKQHITFENEQLMHYLYGTY